MLSTITDITSPSAPQMMRPRSAANRMTAPCLLSDAPGENRLDFGMPAVNGFVITGLEAHAAVRMHVTPAAAGTSWTYVQKPKAPTSSAGRLRAS
jgi:hypothetical protein